MRTEKLQSAYLKAKVVRVPLVWSNSLRQEGWYGNSIWLALLRQCGQMTQAFKSSS